MDNKEKLDTDIKQDAEKAEAISDKEQHDYKVDTEKHTDDREKTIKDDAEKSERLNDDEKKDYQELKQDYSETDKRYPSRDEFDTLRKRMDDIEAKYGVKENKDDDLIIDLDRKDDK